MLDAAETLDDLRVPPGNRLEALRGELTEPCWSGGATRPAYEFNELSSKAAAVLAGDFLFLPEHTISRLVSQAHYRASAAAAVCAKCCTDIGAPADAERGRGPPAAALGRDVRALLRRWGGEIA